MVLNSGEIGVIPGTPLLTMAFNLVICGTLVLNLGENGVIPGTPVLNWGVD